MAELTFTVAESKNLLSFPFRDLPEFIVEISLKDGGICGSRKLVVSDEGDMSQRALGAYIVDIVGAALQENHNFPISGVGECHSSCIGKIASYFSDFTILYFVEEMFEKLNLVFFEEDSTDREVCSLKLFERFGTKLDSSSGDSGEEKRISGRWSFSFASQLWALSQQYPRIDDDIFMALMEGEIGIDYESFKELVRMLLSATPLRYERLGSNLHTQNWEILASEAHYLKSSYGVLGLARLNWLMGELERAARRQDLRSALTNYRLAYPELFMALHFLKKKFFL